MYHTAVTTPGTPRLLLARDYSWPVTPARQDMAIANELLVSAVVRSYPAHNRQLSLVSIG